MKNNRLFIIGASGHGKVVADIALLNGYTDIAFLDDNESLTECAGWPVIGKTKEAPDGEVFIAIGNSTIRKQLLELYSDRTVPVLIHPNAVIARDVQIGKGTVVMAGAIINSGSIVGKGVIVNTSSSIDHDCFVGDYSHISVDAHYLPPDPNSMFFNKGVNLCWGLKCFMIICGLIWGPWERSGSHGR